MLKNFNKDVIVKYNENIKMKFSYNKEMGIYYSIIKNNKIIKKNIVINNSFNYFHVIKDSNDNINIICQNEVGNIILYKLMKNKWKYKEMFCINTMNITPIKIKKFFCENYYVFSLDNNPKKIYGSYDLKKIDTLYYDKNNIDIDFEILSYEDNNTLIINSTAFNMDRILIKVFDNSKEVWNNEQLVYVSKNKYIDKSYLLTKNTIHFLILINESKVKSVIYKNINANKNGFQKEIILFQNKEISSCIISTINNVLWAVWISENKIYASYSSNLGEDFSEPKVYKYITYENIEKIGILQEGNIKEVYFYEENEKINLFLEDILKVNKFNLYIEHKNIDYNLEKITIC